MPNVKVVPKSTDFHLSITHEVMGKLNKESGRFVTDGAAKKVKKRIQDKATEHYQNLGSAIKAQLKHGFPGPDSEKARKIKAYDPEGESVNYTTGKWPALSHPYIRKAPISTKMWRKRGLLYFVVRHELPKRKMKVKAKKKSQERVYKQKGGVLESHLSKPKKTKKIEVRYELLFPKLGGKSLRQLMTIPFVYADKKTTLGFSTRGLNRFNSDLLGYPEMAAQEGNPRKKRPGPLNRPWVAGFSELLGQRMHKAVRKL